MSGTSGDTGRHTDRAQRPAIPRRTSYPFSNYHEPKFCTDSTLTNLKKNAARSKNSCDFSSFVPFRTALVHFRALKTSSNPHQMPDTWTDRCAGEMMKV